MTKRMLILGATGNIGSALVQGLKENNADFVAGVPAAELPKLKARGIQGVAVDFDDPASLENAMKGVEQLFMLLPFARPMIGWARNIIDAAAKSMVKFIVRSSLLDASPDSPYGLYNVHGQIDKMVRTSGIAYAITHPNSFMQNFVVYYGNTIVNQDAVYFCHGDAPVSYTDVRDIAAADCAILLNPAGHQNREYNLTGPEALTTGQAVALISDAVGRQIRYVQVSEQQYVKSMKDMGMSPWDIDMDLSLEHHIRDGKSAVISGHVKQLVGRDPIPFRQFARDYADRWEKVPVHA